MYLLALLLGSSLVSVSAIEHVEGRLSLLEITETQCTLHEVAPASLGFVTNDASNRRGAIDGDGRLRCFYVPFIDEAEYGCSAEQLVAADDREQARRERQLVLGYSHDERDFWAAQQRLTDTGIDAPTALAYLADLPRLVVSQRGACSFADKAAAVSTLGHAALLVVDTTGPAQATVDPLPIMDISGEPADTQQAALAVEVAAIVGETRALHWAAAAGAPLAICLGKAPPRPTAREPRDELEPAATTGNPLVRDPATLAAMGLGPCVVRRETCAAPCANATVAVKCAPAEVVAAGACVGLAAWATSAPTDDLRSYECLGMPTEQPFDGLVAAFATCCGR